MTAILILFAVASEMHTASMRFYRLGDTMTVRVAEDRSMCVQPSQVVQTAWVDIDLCKLGCRSPMSPEAVEKKFRRLLNIGDCAAWPPIVGHWEGERFLIDDGRHDYLASLMLGREKVFVCWLQDVPLQPNLLAANPPQALKVVERA